MRVVQLLIKELRASCSYKGVMIFGLVIMAGKQMRWWQRFITRMTSTRVQAAAIAW
jgi:hypothetical protein